VLRARCGRGILDVVLVETPQDDADFDLEVKLQPVESGIYAGQPVTQLDCTTSACSQVGCPPG
jgi:hypothetical protein